MVNRLWRKCRGVALLVSLAVNVQGCSILNAKKPRYGPHPDSDLRVDATREDVERLLGKPVEASTLADGRLRALYKYTVRQGTFGSGDVTIACFAFVFTFGLSELLFMPIAYFQKEKRTYLKEYIYHQDGTIAETSPEQWQIIF